MRRLAVVLTGLAIASAAHAQTVVINSSVAVNTTWGPTGTVVGTVFWVQSNIAVNSGVTLTIEPGVVVKFNLFNGLTVNGTLNADGTPVSSIYFTSIRDDAVGGDTNGDGNTTVPAASDWVGLTFPDAAPDASLLDYCDIRYAGYSQRGALLFTSNSSTVSNSIIRRGYFGIDCSGTAAPTISATSIEASTQTPVVLDFTATPALSSLAFSSANNGYDAFGLRGTTLTSGVTTLPQRGATVGVNPITNVTYVLLGSLTINAGASLTVNPGVVIKPTAGYTITVNGTLTMNGTAAAGDTITLTSIHDDNFGQPQDTNNNGSITAPSPGNWGRITFSQTGAGSLQHCRIKFGSNSASLGMVEMTNTSIPVSNCLLSDAAHGLAMFGVSNPAITDVAINNCSSTPILMSVSANPTLTNVSFLANAITALGLNGENVAVNSQISQRTAGGYANITYYLMNGQLVMQSPAVLTVDPGVVIKNQFAGGGMQIDGALVADGTPGSPIVFTSERDDNYGNPADTNGDGSITVPAQGNWSYIRFTGTSDDATSKLDNCRITYGSYGPFDGLGTTNLWITSAAPPVTSCTITHGAYGMRIDGNSTPLVDGNTFSNCGQAPILMSVLADPNITATNTFSTNTYNAIALMSETLSQDATIKYRPGVGSPTFAYLPTGQITVASGVTLAIQPQVVIKPSSSFTVFNVNGALNVVGSNGTTGRVIFTSRRDDNPLYGGDTTPNDASTPQAGDWGGIQLNDTAVDAACIFRNILFQFGGAGGQDQGVITTVSASPKLARLEYFQNVTAMTFKGNSQPTVDSTNILNCTQLPIVASLISDPQFPTPANVTLANNTYTAFGILGETVAQNVRTVTRNLGTITNIAYVPTTTITIAFGATWTINPGVVIKFGRYAVDPFGILVTIDGALVADGKPESLIVFTSSPDDAFGGDVRSDGALTSPAPGQWFGINFSGISNDLGTVVDHCRIRYGGIFSNGALRFTNAGPTITNTFVTSAATFGVYIEGNSTPTFTNCNLDSTTGPPVQMSLLSEPVFNTVQFLGNTYTALGVIGESIAQDVLWKIRAVAGRNNMPYLLQATLTTGLGATVTLQPGLMVKLTGGVNIQRAFVAEGRTQPESLIVFTSYRDDFYGGDTNNDGAATAPAASDWNYVTVEGTAIDPQVRFRNCVFRYGGSGTTLGALRCVNSSPSVDSSAFAFNSVGISVEGASNPAVHGSSLYGNTQFAINNTGNSFCVNAEGNWWGSASGPNDASAAADLCGLGANASTGNNVSNNVDYSPYATGGLLTGLLGDVSLNGQVLAYDASLVLQAVVALITLSPLQELVADVSGTGGVTAFDASLILQWVAGIILAFPAASNQPNVSAEDIAAARAVAEAARGDFGVSLGTPVREGDEWLVPVRVEGTAPVYSFELRLAGASGLVGVGAAGAALGEVALAGGEARAALAAARPLGHGEVAVLRLSAKDGADGVPPRLLWARVNESPAEVVDGAAAVPAVSFLARPGPNPARDGATLQLGVAAADAGRPVSVEILDLAGRQVRTLLRGEAALGRQTLSWNLRDDAGAAVPAGVYLVQGRIGATRSVHRLVVVR